MKCADAIKLIARALNSAALQARQLSDAARSGIPRGAGRCMWFLLVR